MLRDAGWQVVAFSRIAAESGFGVEWRQLPLAEHPSPQPSTRRGEGVTPYWICVAPIWVLPDYFALIEAAGARRVVVLSSTSRFTKVGSGDMAEQATVAQLIEGEARLQAWAESRGIEWVILRPTLIYGLGRDKNINEIARFIRRFGFFPVLGEAIGLRQPIHAEDVAGACVSALQAPGAANRAYNISGGETLSYREMVVRVFAAVGRRPRVLTVPLWAFRLAVSLLRFLPRYRLWSAGMAERMNRDLVFDHAEAARDLGFKPRAFALAAEDLP
jgi:nucleoside-diphosphate-sugar epimerase